MGELLHPISQMTTVELRNLRHALEVTLAMETLPRYFRSREELEQDLSEVIAEQDERALSSARTPMRDHVVSDLTDGELERARRELAASLALSQPDSPIRTPIEARMTAIDAELAERTTRADGLSAMIHACSNGFATDDDDWLADRPSHRPPRT